MFSLFTPPVGIFYLGKTPRSNKRERVKKMDYEQTLKVVLENGFAGSRLEHTGGGIMVVSIPLPTPLNRYQVAWLNEFGCGVYAQEWDDEALHFFDFEDAPTYTDVLDALEWLEGLEGVTKGEPLSIHEHAPAVLSLALANAIGDHESITYEYPSFWQIVTAKDTYELGDANGVIGWNNQEGTIGGELPNSSEFTAPDVIALAFAKWLETVEGN